MSGLSQLTFKAGDLVKVEGTYDSAMPTSMVGILIDLAYQRGDEPMDEQSNIWNVQFTNGVILKIWQGHLINLHEELSA